MAVIMRFSFANFSAFRTRSCSRLMVFGFPQYEQPGVAVGEFVTNELSQHSQ